VRFGSATHRTRTPRCNGLIMFDYPSCPASIEDMDYQWRACCRREKGTARVEVKTATNHDEKEEKQTNHQRALFDLRKHDDTPMRPGLRWLLQPLFPVLNCLSALSS